jgi:predicted nucleotidyltransferase
MLPRRIESQDVQETLQTDPCISKSVSVEEGFAVLKGYERLFSERPFREKTSKKFRGTAEAFIKDLKRRTPYVELMAVCGSVAYGSAKDTDDIDLFILSEENRMWLTFFKALLLARVFNMKAKVIGERTDFCLSYMQDKQHFEEEITRHRSPLFAREFLSLYVIDGTNCYGSILKKTEWMREAFPGLYASKRTGRNENETCNSRHSLRAGFQDGLNLFIYVLLGGFLRFKAFRLNLNYRKEGRTKDLFEAAITRGSCVYTSRRYRELENVYNSLDSWGGNSCSNWNQAKS